MWTYDLAREQAPSYEHLRRLLEVTRGGGYNAFGLYMEHRFAYPSAPQFAGMGAVTPEMVAALENEFPDIQIIPFVNLLGHFEGLLYTEAGRRYREELFRGLQACPSCAEFVELAGSLLKDVLQVFSSPIVHIGGDETWQLGLCPRCTARMAGWEGDAKARLYGEHFGPLAQQVIDAGRRPAVWGDMFQEHPSAVEILPKETLIFDWQYFKSPLETSREFMQKGFDVVCCPSVQTYNSVWCHLTESELNVRDAFLAAEEIDAEGVCVTTWECGLFGNYETLLPLIEGAGKFLSAGEPAQRWNEWSQIMGVDLPKLGGVFGHTEIRSSLKCRLLLYSNPFLAWLHHHEELAGDAGTKAHALLDHAMQVAEGPSERGVTQFVIKAIEFVRYADQARQAYAQELPGVAIASLAPCRQIFEDLERIAVATQVNIGGSIADVHRCRFAREAVERAIRRIKDFGDGSLGYLPAFEVITHPNFVPHDQACWWLINSWARE